MCTGIVESAPMAGSGKGQTGWFKLEQVNVSYDHPIDASLEHAVNIDFVSPSIGPGARVAVELDPASARKLVEAILATLLRGEPPKVESRNNFPQERLGISGFLEGES